MEKPPAPRRRLGRRLFRAGVVLLCMAGLVYVVGANVFLNVEARSEWINRHPEKVSITWEHGWTLIPGLVHLSGIDVGGRSAGAVPRAWNVHLDSARVLIDPTRLVDRRLRIARVWGSGVDFRLARAEGVLATSSPPTRPMRAASAREPWSFEIDGVTLRGVWRLAVEDFHYSGRGRLRGRVGFATRGGPLRIEAVALGLRQGSLFRRGQGGDDVLAEDLDLDLEGRIAPFSPREMRALEHPALEILRRTTAVATLHAARADFGALKALFGKVDWISLDGSGRIGADLRLGGGELLEGSRVDIEEARFAVAWLDDTARGHGKLTARLADGMRARVEAVFDGFEIFRSGAAEPHIRGQGLAVRAITSPIDWVEKTVPTADLTIDLPASQLLDLGFYNSYLPSGSGLELRGGTARVDAHVEVSTRSGKADGDFHLSGDRVAGSFGGFAFIGDLELTSRLRDGDPATRSFRLESTHLGLRNVAVLGAGAVSEDWWADFDLSGGTVRLAEPLELDARVEARLRDTRPILGLIAEKRPLLAWMRPLPKLEDVEMQARLRFVGEALALDDLTLRNKRLDMLAHLRVEERRPSGIVYIKYGPLAAALELGDGGEKEWTLRRPLRWYEDRRARMASPR